MYFMEFFILMGEAYNSFLSSLPFWVKSFINFFMISLVIFIYAILIWKFYRFIAKKNILELNLSRRVGDSSSEKFFSSILNVLEYVIILPLLVFIWFGVLTIFLIILTDNIPVSIIILISATVVTAIRMTAYYKEDLSRDLAKLLPFSLLGVFITQYTAFNFGRVLEQISSIPSLFGNILYYMGFVLAIELILRILDLFFQATGIIPPYIEEED